MVSMKLSIPFYERGSNCGSNALRMVAAYFGKIVSENYIRNAGEMGPDELTNTIGLAIAAAEMGFTPRLLSKYSEFNRDDLDLEWYKELPPHDIQKFARLAKDRKIEIEKRIMSLDEVLSFANRDSVPIVAIDADMLSVLPRGTFVGHAVTVVGYDVENVFVHDGEPFEAICRGPFDKARRARGTEEDVLVVYRNKEARSNDNRLATRPPSGP
ncbi:MAG: peptidase C39 family protein [Candidatus Aenigmatarchaeota archaeon]|nr:MAG: peptidase C39 family protein [Candidatus Aenigmarchaeota archaeon]